MIYWEFFSQATFSIDTTISHIVWKSQQIPKQGPHYSSSESETNNCKIRELIDDEGKLVKIYVLVSVTNSHRLWSTSPNDLIRGISRKVYGSWYSWNLRVCF